MAALSKRHSADRVAELRQNRRNIYRKRLSLRKPTKWRPEVIRRLCLSSGAYVRCIRHWREIAKQKAHSLRAQYQRIWCHAAVWTEVYDRTSKVFWTWTIYITRLRSVNKQAIFTITPIVATPQAYTWTWITFLTEKILFAFFKLA